MLAGPVTWIPRRSRAARFARCCASTRCSARYRIRQALLRAFTRADVVHVHSNGLLAEVAVLLARRRRLPVVLTLYGTEIWHYRPKRLAPDLFTRAYRAASIVTFYSDGLLARARELGLGRRQHGDGVSGRSAPEFVFHDRRRAGARSERGSTSPAATC